MKSTQYIEEMENVAAEINALVALANAEEWVRKEAVMDILFTHRAYLGYGALRTDILNAIKYLPNIKQVAKHERDKYKNKGGKHE